MPPQIVTATHAAVKASRRIPTCGSAKYTMEDLDENRRVSDDLDVDRGELAGRPGGDAYARAEDDADEGGPQIEIAETLMVFSNPSRSSRQFSDTNDERS